MLQVGAVSVAFTRASVKGEKGQRDISGVSIDPKVFFTILPVDILFEVGASSESLKAKLELEGGSIVEAPIYSVIVSAHGRENVTLAATYEGAPPVRVSPPYWERSSSKTLGSKSIRKLVC